MTAVTPGQAAYEVARQAWIDAQIDLPIVEVGPPWEHSQDGLRMAWERIAQAAITAQEQDGTTLARLAQENIRLAAENRMLRESAAAALKLALEADGTDGAHHKQWLLDQVTRALTGGQQHLEDQGITP